MSYARKESKRKLELLDRYRALRLEERLETLRQLAEQEAEQDRYPWKGEFRDRDEILDLYRTRKRWDRRYMIDLLVVVVLLLVVFVGGRTLVKMFTPTYNLTSETEQ
ncbi:MAG: hypothetical protein DWQ01_15200 [Planctomycetota bacterium]|nr:MAG: hypothetical protein DWQ01_15200 [Planctomycetota bacterium]